MGSLADTAEFTPTTGYARVKCVCVSDGAYELSVFTGREFEPVGRCVTRPRALEAETALRAAIEDAVLCERRLGRNAIRARHLAPRRWYHTRGRP
jgi:hypothetical protein